MQKSVTRRIVDRRVLHLIKMWLDCPVEAFSPREALQGRVVDVEREGFLILLSFEHRWH